MSSRMFWREIEAIHAVTYFADESITAAKAAGLRGFWMGYFGFRAAPLGAVEPAVIEAAFANFEPTMVRRAIPNAWSYAEPAALVAARSSAAAASLRRLSPRVDRVAAAVDQHLQAVISHASSIARPLFAANRDVPSPQDPVERLWQHCTSLREHRGDGHVAALATAGIDGCEAHLLLAAEHHWPPEVFMDNRGWSLEQQQHARARLATRDLLDGYDLTPAGAALRAHVEAVTDSLAAEPYEHSLSTGQLDALVAALGTVGDDIRNSATIPFPNPMGLTRPK